MYGWAIGGSGIRGGGDRVLVGQEKPIYVDDQHLANEDQGKADWRTD